jgi:hypothetical protein
MKKVITIFATIFYSSTCLFSQNPVFNHVAIYVTNLEKSAAPAGGTAPNQTAGPLGASFLASEH